MSDTIESLSEKHARVFTLHSSSILRIAFSYMKNMSDAEDVLQDTMLALVKKEAVFISAEHEKAWLFRVAINLCKNKLKSSWFKTIPIPEDMQSFDITEDEYEAVDAVQSLSVKYREVVHLYYIEGYSTSEIARILHKNESTVMIALILCGFRQEWKKKQLY